MLSVAGWGGVESSAILTLPQVDAWLDVTSGRIVSCAVLQVAPGEEEQELGAGGASAVFEVLGRASERKQHARAAPSPRHPA